MNVPKDKHSLINNLSLTQPDIAGRALAEILATQSEVVKLVAVE